MFYNSEAKGKCFAPPAASVSKTNGQHKGCEALCFYVAHGLLYAWARPRSGRDTPVGQGSWLQGSAFSHVGNWQIRCPWSPTGVCTTIQRSKKQLKRSSAAPLARLLRSRLLCLNHRGTVLARQRQSFDSIQSSISNPHPAEPAVAALETVEGADDEDALGDDGDGLASTSVGLARFVALLVRILLREAKAPGTPSIR